jgi:hypothetical protein
MEYLIILLLLSLIVVLFFKNPTLKEKTINLTLDEFEKQEAEIIKATYNYLPKDVKSKIDSKVYAQLASYIIDIGTKVVREDIKK